MCLSMMMASNVLEGIQETGVANRSEGDIMKKD